MSMKRQGGPGRAAAGVTLVELLVVVAIIGILAAIGIPSYQAYVQKTNRQEGKACLMDVHQRQERYFTRFNQYAPDFVALGYDEDDLINGRIRCGIQDPNKAGEDLYRVRQNNPSNGCPITRCYQLVALARNVQDEDGDLRIRMDRNRDDPNKRSREQRRVDGSWENWE